MLNKIPGISYYGIDNLKIGDGGYLVPAWAADCLILATMLKIKSTGHGKAIRTIFWFMYGRKPEG